MHGDMQQLMNPQHKLMLQHNEIILKQYLEMKVIHQSDLIIGDVQDYFLYEASKTSCLKGCKPSKNII